jgi:hypothetical protein
MHLDRSAVTLVGLVAIALLGGCGGAPASEGTSETDPLTGNGAPSGAHYNLNIIGVSNAKSASNGGGNVIFVPLDGTAKIALSQGPFAVLDANGTDGTAAFQLPSPDPTNTGTTTYSVWARALGKPGGSSTTTTCATDPTTGELYCSVYSSVLLRQKGGSTFTDVSKSLLYVYADVNGDGKTERYPLFDSALQDYFWSYQSNGLKLAQLRFYPVPSMVP